MAVGSLRTSRKYEYISMVMSTLGPQPRMLRHLIDPIDGSSKRQEVWIPAWAQFVSIEKMIQTDQSDS